VKKTNSKVTDVIVLKNIHKVYSIEAQAVQALRGVDLVLKKNQLVSVIGRSGAGKSTLLHIIGTLDRATHGTVLINGTDVSKLSDSANSLFRNKTLGFVFQMRNLFNEFSALENVMLPGMIAGVAKAKIKERAAKMLAAVGLSHRENHRPGELSGGEQQRVTIARALLMAPPILLADEPTGNLDKQTSLAIQGLLLGLCEEYKTTMLLVTHDLELASRLPHQIVMEDGMIIDRGDL
jgi:lipoprotein-releasing system ATP-binding protein